MSDPFWLAEAAAACPTEAAQYERLKAELQGLPHDATMRRFADLYEQMLEARDAVYNAWISREMDLPLPGVPQRADACRCRRSDAWRCARDRGLRDTIACYCRCHRRGRG